MVKILLIWGVCLIAFADEFYCLSLFEQRDLLQTDESRRIVNLIKDDMSSLLWLRDEDSHHSRISISTENSHMLNKIFDFDHEIFNSKVYQVAIRSNMRQALSKKADTTAQRERFPFLSNGLNLGTSSASAALERSRKIDEQLCIENEERKASASAVILGNLHSGMPFLVGLVMFLIVSSSIVCMILV